MKLNFEELNEIETLMSIMLDLETNIEQVDNFHVRNTVESVRKRLNILVNPQHLRTEKEVEND